MVEDSNVNTEIRFVNTEFDKIDNLSMQKPALSFVLDLVKVRNHILTVREVVKDNEKFKKYNLTLSKVSNVLENLLLSDSFDSELDALNSLYSNEN